MQSSSGSSTASAAAAHQRTRRPSAPRAVLSSAIVRLISRAAARPPARSGSFNAPSCSLAGRRGRRDLHHALLLESARRWRRGRQQGGGGVRRQATGAGTVAGRRSKEGNGQMHLERARTVVPWLSSVRPSSRTSPVARVSTCGPTEAQGAAAACLDGLLTVGRSLEACEPAGRRSRHAV